MARRKVIKEEPSLVEEVLKPKRDRRMFTLFFVVVFSLLIAMTRSITNTFVALFFQVVLIFSQIIIVKNLIDSYMGED
jgi:hypothetical protein